MFIEICVVGVLMGIAMRTGSPLALSLAEPVWKQLAGQQLAPADLTEVDKDYVPGLLCIRDMDDKVLFYWYWYIYLRIIAINIAGVAKLGTGI